MIGFEYSIKCLVHFPGFHVVLTNDCVTFHMIRRNVMIESENTRVLFANDTVRYFS